MFNKKDNLYHGYIYRVTNNINNKVYIGQTSTSIEKRWTQHKSAARTAKNNKIIFYNAINKYGEDNFTIDVIYEVSCITKDELIDELNDLEIYYISIYNSLIPNGYNLTSGGNNCSVRNMKSVTSYFYDGTKDMTFDSANEGAIYYHADSSHILQCCNGNAQSCKSRIWRYSDDPFDKFEINISKEQLENGYNLVVDKYTLDGIYLNTYNSLGEAIKDDENVGAHTPISLCCKGIYNQAYGYVWRYSGEPYNKYAWKDNECYTPVDVYTIDGEFIRSFDSIANAQRYFSIKSNAHIISCCNGERVSCANLVWRYKGEPFDKYRTERRIKTGKLYNHYDLNNNFIESISGVKNLSNCPNKVHDCCNGLITHVDDSKWFYADDINNPDKSRIIGKPKDYGTKNNIPIIFNKFIEPICVYDRYGRFIKEYDNARELSKEQNIFTQAIYDVCDGKFAYNDNFVYRYKRDSFYLYYDFSYIKKHINVYDKDNNFIMTCFDIQECIRQLKLNTKRGSSIQKCLSHDRKYAYGYQFFRVDDPTQPDKSKIITIDNYKQQEVS